MLLRKREGLGAGHEVQILILGDLHTVPFVGSFSALARYSRLLSHGKGSCF